MSFAKLISGIVLLWILIFYVPGVLVAAGLILIGWLAWFSYKDDEAG